MNEATLIPRRPQNFDFSPVHSVRLRGLLVDSPKMVSHFLAILWGNIKKKRPGDYSERLHINPDVFYPLSPTQSFASILSSDLFDLIILQLNPAIEHFKGLVQIILHTKVFIIGNIKI